MSRFEQRRDRLRRLMRKSGANAMLVTDFTNVSYLTGFTGDDSYLLVTDKRPIVFSDPRYSIQLEEECPGIEKVIRKPGTSLVQAVAEICRSVKPGSLAFEADGVTVELKDRFDAELPKQEWVPTTGLVLHLREIKDAEEITALRFAVALAEKTFAVVRASLRAEQTEKEIADAIDHQIRLFGGEGCSFVPIVGVGDRAALAHYQPGQKRVGESNLLLVDWGAIGRRYFSDLTRVLVTGKPSAKLGRIYNVVLAAQQRAIDAIRPGAVMEDIDAAARKVIVDAGFGKRFGHSLGHGIGLEIHEQPRLAINEKRQLRTGMVVTVEPGIYVPGWGGVRIEDDVLVTRGGHEVLSSVPKEFDQCRVEVL